MAFTSPPMTVTGPPLNRNPPFADDIAEPASSVNVPDSSPAMFTVMNPSVWTVCDPTVRTTGPCWTSPHSPISVLIWPWFMTIAPAETPTSLFVVVASWGAVMVMAEPASSMKLPALTFTVRALPTVTVWVVPTSSVRPWLVVIVRSTQTIFTRPLGARMLMVPVFASVVMVSAAVSNTMELLVELSTSRIFSAPSESRNSRSWPARLRNHLWSLAPSGLPGPGTACSPFQTAPRM